MKLLCYTRIPEEDEIYSAKLAYSMHLALYTEEGIRPLNHNSGILYAKATQNSDGTLNAKSLKNPWLFPMADGTFGVIAERIEPDGSADLSATGKLLFFTSKDLINYLEQPLLVLGDHVIEDAVCRYLPETARYQLMWKEADGRSYLLETEDLTGISADYERKCLDSKNDSGNLRTASQISVASLPEGAVSRNVLEISENVANRLKARFLTPENIANEVPQSVRVSSPDELKAVKALARYSDGSCVEKRVDWYMDGIDWNKPGRYSVEGRVHQNRYEFPVAWHKADPCIGKWKGKYYFISTNDLDHEHSIYIREADSIPGLVTAQQVKILDAYTYPHLGNLLWAPELHVIQDRLYVFHAGTPQEFLEEQCHVMALKEGGNPMRASDWEMPRRVVKKDGSCLYGEAGITLDMTEFEVGGKYYVCWSQRQFKPVDQGAWLYIACIDPKEPWKLISDPVLLSMPEYGWANNHTFVDEGPFALITEDRIFLTFSSAAVDSTYVVGLMSANPNADLLKPENWVKENYPLLSSRSAEGEFGPGHNAYVIDDDGLVWNTYHARPGVNGPRSSGIRRVHFNAEGFPVLDMTEEMDLKPELAVVSTEVVIP
ncbi:MAG: family 43 glycosylhydrolase [Acetatifactor sp.]|nr:family 43 glycosylhydrolase [Acetatifactor sp.]